jgi:hypothetical protein
LVSARIEKLNIFEKNLKNLETFPKSAIGKKRLRKIVK